MSNKIISDAKKIASSKVVSIPVMTFCELGRFISLISICKGAIYFMLKMVVYKMIVLGFIME